MTKNFIKTIFITILFFVSTDTFSQPSAIFFSVTGDTICYSDLLIPNGDGGLRAYVKKKVKADSLKTISTFLLDCDVSGCIETLNKDTIKKYCLQFDGKGLGIWTNKDFVISIKPSNTHTVDLSAFGPKYIFQTTVSVDIRCKGYKLYSKTFDIMYKGESEKDFPEHDIVRIEGWQKKSKGKYFVELHVKEYQTFKKPGDSPDYGFKSFQFIL